MSLILKHADLLTRDTLGALLDASGGHHVTIYMPTHREWSAVHEDPIRLKNLLRKARSKLEESGMRAPSASQFLEKAEDLVERDNFWQYQSDGLALFLTGNTFRYFRLPLELDELVIVGDRFYLKPLFELFVDDGCFYVLSLSQGDVRLSQCTKHSIREIRLLDTSLSLSDATRFDQEERHLGSHTTASRAGVGKSGSAVFHGQGSSADDASMKTKLLQFIHELEPAVRKALTHESAPLVLAGSASIRAMYTSANHYHHLLDSGVDCEPSSLTPEELHERSLALVQPLFAEARRKAAAAFGQYVGAGSMHVASDIESVLSAAYQHRVSKLFLPKGKYVWGRFDKKSGAVQVHSEMRAGDLELLDLAAAYTLQGNGEIYAVSPTEMPEESSIAAVLRY
ncbi:MAG: hypothetical protein HKN13_04415 [Rhodothermales bacterium]|nr:hypothetical protein [Rhodothermales bacterium]